MPAQAFQTDDQIAQVLTYVRNSFGNQAPAVLPAQVAALRGEVGKPSLIEADLTPPSPAPEAAPESAESNAAETQTVAETKPEVEPYRINTRSPLSGWLILLLACVLAVGVFMVVKRTGKG